MRRGGRGKWHCVIALIGLRAGGIKAETEEGGRATMLNRDMEGRTGILASHDGKRGGELCWKRIEIWKDIANRGLVITNL